MLIPRIIPLLLLRRGGLYKGVRFGKHKYVGDPMNAVRVFNEKRADEILFVDIEATRERRMADPDFVQKVADEAYMPFGVGGGVRAVEDMRILLRHGAEKVLINTAAVENPELISEGAGIFGSQSILVGIDYVRSRWRGAVVVTHSGRKKTSRDPVEWAVEVAERGAGEILLTSVDRDGTGRGYDLEMIGKVSRAVRVPVVACGGAGCYDDLKRAIEAGASAAAAGSLFVFYGPHRAVLINYPACEAKDGASGEQQL